MVDINLEFTVKDTTSLLPKVNLKVIKPLTLIRYSQHPNVYASISAIYLGELNNNHLVMDMQGCVQQLPRDIVTSENNLFQIISAVLFDFKLKEDEVIQNSRPELLTFNTIFRHSKDLILKLHNSSTNEMLFLNVCDQDNRLSDIAGLKNCSADTTYTGVLTITSTPKENLYSINIEKYTSIYEEHYVPLLNVPKLPEDKVIPITDLILKTHKDAMSVGESIRLEYKILPLNATHTQIKWESSNPKIFSVNNGVLTCHNYGNAEIHLKTLDNKFGQTLNVSNNPPVVFSASFMNDYTITGIAKSGLYLEVYNENMNLLYRDIVPPNGIFNVVLNESYNSGESFRLRLSSEDGYCGDFILISTRTTPKYIYIYKDGVKTDHIKGNIGAEGKFTTKSFPSKVSDATGYWTSSDVNVLHIRQDGSYKLLKKGSAFVYYHRE